MGILKDIIEKKAMEIVERRVNEKQESNVEQIDIKTYNRYWLDRIARETGFAVSDNDTRVDNILKKLNERDGHCPCGGMTDEFICPCIMMRKYGTCKCGLYMDVKDIEPKDSKSTARIKDE